MKKMYEKSEIMFAVFWIVVYTVSMSFLRNLGDDSPYMMIGLIVISALMLLFVMKNGLAEKYGLSGWAKNSRAMLWFLPLWIITTINLWAGVTPRFSMPGQLFVIVSMAFVGFAEELIFRGFLFKAMLKDCRVSTAVTVSAVTFGVGHIVNLLTGHELAETLMQVVFAVAYGFLVTLAFYKGGSLIPCILSHSLFDIFAQFAPDNVSPLLNWVSHGIMIILTGLYCLYLVKRVDTPPINRIGGQKAKSEENG